MYLLVDTRDLTKVDPGDKALAHWPAVAAWWASRLQSIGPSDEQVDLVFVRAHNNAGLDVVHPTWAGTFVLAALVFLIPDVNFVLLDSDCVPVTLFEVEKLWKLTTEPMLPPASQGREGWTALTSSPGGLQRRRPPRKHHNVSFWSQNHTLTSTQGLLLSLSLCTMHHLTGRSLLCRLAAYHMTNWNHFGSRRQIRLFKHIASSRWNGQAVDFFTTRVHQQNTVRDVLVSLAELSHLRNNRMIQPDGVSLDLYQTLPAHVTIFTVEASDELPTSHVKLGIDEDFGFSIERQELMRFSLIYFNGRPSNSLRWFNARGLQVSFSIREDVGVLSTTDIELLTPPSGKGVAIILQIEEASESFRVARFIIDLTTFVYWTTVREVVHAQCALHCITGAEGNYDDQYGVDLNPTRSVAAGVVIRHVLQSTGSFSIPYSRRC